MNQHPIQPLPGIIILGNKTGWQALSMKDRHIIAFHNSLGGLLARLTSKKEVYP